MNVLVTAGNTLAPIDKVRCITNVFTGRTGAAIALEAYARGHRVTLLTSHPEAAAELAGGAGAPGPERWRLDRYRTFEDLEGRMAEAVTAGGFDAVVHCAAVSDYLSAGVYAPAEGTSFDPSSGRWRGEPPALLDRRAGKVKSDEAELWVRLVRAPKLVDRVRADWGFRGLLVKFKLEVGLTDEQLLEVAERSRAHSGADLMVANTLEGAPFYAFLGAGPGGYERVSRRGLARRLLEVLEERRRSRPGG
jgi:phosphopantothenoylcysteine synthetase/decarboxylase